MNKDFESTFAGRWIRNLAANLRKIIIFCFVVALAASAWALTRKQMWVSHAVVVVPGAQQSSLGLSGIGGFAGDILSDQLGGMGSILGMGESSALDMNMVIQVMTSRNVKERLIFDYDLLNDLNVPTMDHAIMKFSKRFSVSLTDEGFIVVSIKAESREEAAAMVNHMIAIANDELSTIITSRARRSRLAAEEMLRIAEDSLMIAQTKMEHFREETGVLFPEEQGIQTTALYASLETELIQAEAELAGIGNTLSSSSAAYSEIASRVQYLRESMREKAAGDSLSFFPGLDSMPSVLMEYENLAIELETRRVIYLMLRQELESLKLEEVKDSPTIEVLVPAVPTALRSYPKRGVMVIKYTFVALLLVLLWMAVLTYAKQVLQDESTGPYWKSVYAKAMEQLFIRRKGQSRKTSGTGSKRSRK
ncbi:MAG: hypothetical protein GF388_09270 [Candidatus Aegiribacteria sp.]|nr:hypothetical protein [Candidatus Aegiribacteria sp.]MBD3295247.1 hypothetical protein [Candidatus Fermentibacteria bacterium]